MVKQSLNTLQAGNFALSMYWTADGSGNVTVTPASSMPELAQGMRILQVETVPGTPAPTNGYSIALKNSFGTDLMAGAMAAVSSTANQLWAATSASPPFVGLFSLAITGNAVANAQGTVVVYFGASALINSNAGSPGPQGPAGPTGPSGPQGGGVTSSDYTFSQAAQGTLSTGVAKTFNISAPTSQLAGAGVSILGLNGTDSNHYVYISGGTGAAEAVLIQGGTYVSGATSGTIIFTPLNNHSGGWTLTSATAGIQEATIAIGSGRVFVPQGVQNIYAQVTIASAMEIEGASRGSAIIVANSATQNLFYVNSGPPVRIHGLALSANVTKTAGAAIVLDGGNTGSEIDDVEFVLQFNHVSVLNAQVISLHDTYGASTVANGIVINNSAPDTGDSTIYANVWDGSVATGAAILWTSGGGLRIIDNKFLGFQYAIDANAGNSVSTSDFIISNNSFESGAVANGAIRFRATGSGGAGILNVQICDNQITYVGPCIQILTPVQQVIISDNIMQSVGAGLTCVLVTAALIQIQGNRLAGGYSGSVGIDTSGLPGGAQGAWVVQNSMLNVVTPYVANALTVIEDTINQITFAQLPASGNGSVIYCSNGTVANPVAGGGTGCIAKRLNNVWVGN